MRYAFMVLAGLACIVASAFLVAPALGLAALGAALAFIGWASSTPSAPRE